MGLLCKFQLTTLLCFVHTCPQPPHRTFGRNEPPDSIVNISTFASSRRDDRRRSSMSGGKSLVLAITLPSTRNATRRMAVASPLLGRSTDKMALTPSDTSIARIPPKGRPNRVRVSVTRLPSISTLWPSPHIQTAVTTATTAIHDVCFHPRRRTTAVATASEMQDAMRLRCGTKRTTTRLS